MSHEAAQIRRIAPGRCGILSDEHRQRRLAHHDAPGPHPGGAGRTTRALPGHFPGSSPRCRSRPRSSPTRCGARGWKTCSAASARENVQGEVQQKLDVHRQRGAAAHPRRPRGRRRRRLRGERGARDPARGLEGRATLLRAVRSARRLIQPRHLRRRRHHLQHPGARSARAAARADSLLQPGSRQVAAGYVLYGSSTVFVLTIGRGVDMFVLDPQHRRLHARRARPQDPRRATRPTRSTRATARAFRKASSAISTGRRATAIRAAMPAPWWPTCTASCSRAACSCIRRPEGAAGQAAPDVRGQPDGHDRRTGRRQDHGRPAQRIMDIEPTDIHQRTPVILGAADQVDAVLAHL